jgi:hypothetical protein
MILHIGATNMGLLKRIAMYAMRETFKSAKRTVVKAYRKRTKSGKQVIVKSHARGIKRTVKRIPRKEMRWL